MIPVVDFSAYNITVQECDIADKELSQLADKICDAFKTVGFVYIKNHGIPQAQIDGFFDMSRDFFNMPVDTKHPYRVPEDDYWGWMGFEAETLDPSSSAADLKESYNFNPRMGEQATPSAITPYFYNKETEFYHVCRDLTYRVLDMMCIGLKLEKDFLRNCHQHVGKEGNLSSLRSLHYPPITKALKPGQIRCGKHTDYGTVTLLFQDGVGGLEVRPSGSDFVPAKHINNTVLVNLGALMQRWTADKLVATEHRVVIPEEEIGRQQSRQSVAFFVQPDDSVIVECLDGSNKYQPISAIDYLNMRFHATY